MRLLTGIQNLYGIIIILINLAPGFLLFVCCISWNSRINKRRAAINTVGIYSKTTRGKQTTKKTKYYCTGTLVTIYHHNSPPMLLSTAHSVASESVLFALPSPGGSLSFLIGISTSFATEGGVISLNPGITSSPIVISSAHRYSLISCTK